MRRVWLRGELGKKALNLLTDDCALFYNIQSGPIIRHAHSNHILVLFRCSKTLAQMSSKLHLKATMLAYLLMGKLELANLTV